MHQSQSCQRRVSWSATLSLNYTSQAQGMCAMQGLWMCPLLASMCILLVSGRHSCRGARFLTWVLHPSPSKCCCKVDMPRRSTPHIWATYERKSMFSFNWGLGLGPHSQLLDSNNLCITCDYYFFNYKYCHIFQSCFQYVSQWMEMLSHLSQYIINIFFVIATYATIHNC